jgi:hypothetical protein
VIVVDLLNRDTLAPFLRQQPLFRGRLCDKIIFSDRKKGAEPTQRRCNSVHDPSKPADSANDGLGLNRDIHRENLGSRVTWEIPESKTQFGIDKAA